MLDLVVGRQEGPRLLWKDQQNGLAGKVGRKGVSNRGASMKRGEKLWLKQGACLCRRQAHNRASEVMEKRVSIYSSLGPLALG